MSACPHCGATDELEPRPCIHCGKPLGPEYRDLAGTYHEQRAFYFRDCTACGAQHMIRMVKTWQ